MFKWQRSFKFGIMGVPLGILIFRIAFGAGFYNIGVFLKPPAAGNKIAFVQQTTAAGTAASTLGFSAINVTAGNLLVAAFAVRGADAVTSVTDSNLGTATWVHATGFPAAGGSNTSNYDIYYCLNHPGGSTTITLNFNASYLGSGGNLSEFSGVLTANAADTQTTNYVSSSSTAQTGTIATGNAYDLLFGGCADTTTTADTTLSDYGATGGTPTFLTTGSSGGSGTKSTHEDSAYQLTTATGTYGIQMTSSTTVSWCGIVSFKSQ